MADNKAFNRELLGILQELAGLLGARVTEAQRRLEAAKAALKIDDTLANRAGVAEARIRRDEVKKLAKEAEQIIKKSTGRLVISTIEPGQN
jgi:hypothetical protein